MSSIFIDKFLDSPKKLSHYGYKVGKPCQHIEVKHQTKIRFGKSSSLDLIYGRNISSNTFAAMSPKFPAIAKWFCITRNEGSFSPLATAYLKNTNTWETSKNDLVLTQEKKDIYQIHRELLYKEYVHGISS